MSIRKFLLPVLALLAIASCKEEEEEVTYSYLTGSMIYSLPHYLEAGDTCLIRPHGVTHPALKSDSLGIYITDSMFGTRDTLKYQTDPTSSFSSFKFIVGCSRKDSAHSVVPKDTLGTFTYLVAAYAADYYSTSTEKYYVVVKEGYGPGYSLWKGFDATGETVRIEDRDYFVTDIAGKKWLKENLASGSAGCPVDNCPAVRNIFGKMYSWNDAVKACPSGWHLPSKAEWQSALDAAGGHIGGLMGDVYFNGSTADCRMWEYWPAVGAITNSTGLTLLPVGYAQIGHESPDPSEWSYSFYGIWDFGVWWTSDEDPSDTDSGLCAVIQEKNDAMSFDSMPKSYFAASVRCVRD